MKKEQALTYKEALEKYYGGIHAVSKSQFPFTCQCGDKSAMSVGDIFTHIRKGHAERIRNPRKQAVPAQITI